MFSRFLKRSSSLLCLLLLTAFVAKATELRVCSDPNNLPFSDRNLRGFENRIAEAIAGELHARLTYQWQRMGRGFVREVLNKRKCDLLIGVPVGMPGVLTTRPYYRSSYVFVTRRNSAFQPASLDDTGLRNIKIGVQALEEEYTPPGQALSRRGLQNSMVGFYGVGEEADKIVAAVAHGKVDVAIVWGPLAGFAAQRFGSRLAIRPLMPQVDPPGLPLTFQIAMGVRKTDAVLRDQLNAALQQQQKTIDRILASYRVPLLEMTAAAQAGQP